MTILLFLLSHTASCCLYFCGVSWAANSLNKPCGVLNPSKIAKCGWKIEEKLQFQGDG